MRHTSLHLGLVLAVFGLVARADAAPPSTTRYFVTGFGVIAHVYQDDGGVITEGDLYGLTIKHGAVADVPYDTSLAFYGTRDGVFVSGAAEATFVSNGFAGAQLRGTVIVSTFLAPENPGYVAPFTIRADLALAGSGQTYAQALQFTSGSAGSVYVNFAAQRWRTASLGGSVDVQVGVDAMGNAQYRPTVAGPAQLLGVTSGEFNLVAQPSR
jgi:hypothetical protein